MSSSRALPLPRPDPLEPPRRLAAAAVAHAGGAVDRRRRLSRLAPAGRVHARHDPDAQRRLLRQRRRRPRVRQARQAHRQRPGDQRRDLAKAGAGLRRGARAARVLRSCSPPTRRRSCCRSSALAVTLVYPFASASSRCRRRCWASRSASASRWRSPRPRRPRLVARRDPAAVPALAWWLLLGNLFWVLAYDTEYAMVDRDDDLKIGMRTSAITLGRFDVAGVMAFYASLPAVVAVPRPEAGPRAGLRGRASSSPRCRPAGTSR